MRQSTRSIIRYLLGRASAREQTRIEEDYFGDPDSLQHLLTVEDELIDAYLRGELSRGERSRFKRHYMATPQHQEKVEMAQTLMQCLHSGPEQAQTVGQRLFWKRGFVGMLPTRQRPMHFATAALLLLLVVAGMWLLIQNRRLRKQLTLAQEQLIVAVESENELRAEVATQSAARAQVWRETQPAGSVLEHPGQAVHGESSQRIAALILTPGLTRSIDDRSRLVLFPLKQDVLVKLILETSRRYVAYRAELIEAGGASILSRKIGGNRAGVPGQSVTLNVSSTLLHPGDYRITLTGIRPGGMAEIVGDYAFAVIRK